MPAPPTIAHLPTPLERLDRLSASLGIDLWLKRDDQTGLALGGNKTRKLDALCREALEGGADALITTGAPQSNHCRQTAAAAAVLGLEAHLVLGGAGVREITGNLLLDHLLGAQIHWTGEGESRPEGVARVSRALQAAGRRPYVIPLGGSNVTGAGAYADAVDELAGQMRARGQAPFDRIVFASSSGGTQAGIAWGARAQGWSTEVLGISVDEPAETLRQLVVDLCAGLSARRGEAGGWSPGDVSVDDRYCAAGYAALTDLERGAIRRFAQEAGILLDPVYTGRAAGGLLDLVARGAIAPGERVLFWHTGGAPALFAYAGALAGG